MFKFTKLKEWCLTGTRPAFYDTESATAIEQTAKLYGAIKTLIEETEKAVNEINEVVESFKCGMIKDYEDFKCHIDNIMHNYIAMIDDKILLQDKKIDDTIVYIRDNLSVAVKDVVTQMQESGELGEEMLAAISDLTNVVNGVIARVETLENSKPSYTYNQNTKELTFNIEGGEINE